MSQNTPNPTQNTPLLHPHRVSQAHNLLPPAIRFPQANRTDQPPKLPARSREDDLEASNDNSSQFPQFKREGIPKLSRECLVSEIQCYGKYILAVLAVFGLEGILVAFGISRAWV